MQERAWLAQHRETVASRERYKERLAIASAYRMGVAVGTIAVAARSEDR